MLTALVLAAALSAPPAGADLGPAALKASAPFYAALVASAHGNTDATNRQLLLLAARWDAAVREARASGPPALLQDPEWGAALDRATAKLAKARDLARARDIAGAHAELEEIRQSLHEIRERHGVWSLDDRLSEYHEYVERVLGHVSGRGEISLAPRDYQDIDEDLRGAQASWAEVEKAAGPMQAVRAWEGAARDAAAALKQASAAVAAKDRGVVAAAERLKSSYFDLLTALAKARQ
jgi:hypothetical protein